MSPLEKKISIIFADHNFLVVNKPAGVVTHRGKGVRGQILVDWLVTHYPEIANVGDDPTLRPGIVHRLDRDTSGVMIVARTQESFAALKSLFKERRITKTYLALVFGAPAKASGIISTSIGKSSGSRFKRAVGQHALRTRSASTKYRILERFPGFTLIEVKPETGRMHQIRVHFSSVGCPIVGDALYGGARTKFPGLERQFLHAWRLAFSYPEGKRWLFEAALPDELKTILQKLRALRKKK